MGQTCSSDHTRDIVVLDNPNDFTFAQLVNLDQIGLVYAGRGKLVIDKYQLLTNEGKIRIVVHDSVIKKKKQFEIRDRPGKYFVDA